MFPSHTISTNDSLRNRHDPGIERRGGGTPAGIGNVQVGRVPPADLTPLHSPRYDVRARHSSASLSGSVRLGFSQDFADEILPAVLARFSGLYPLVMIKLRIDGNAALVGAVERGGLDVALAVGHAHTASAEVVGSLDLEWIAGETFMAREGQALPLLVLGPQCAFRKEAIRALDDAGVPWRLAAVSPSVTGIHAAARGGLGITARSALGLPEGLFHGKAMFDLPALGEFPVTLHARTDHAGDGVQRLREIIRDTVRSTL